MYIQHTGHDQYLIIPVLSLEGDWWGEEKRATHSVRSFNSRKCSVSLSAHFHAFPTSLLVLTHLTCPEEHIPALFR